MVDLLSQRWARVLVGLTLAAFGGYVCYELAMADIATNKHGAMLMSTSALTQDAAQRIAVALVGGLIFFGAMSSLIKDWRFVVGTLIFAPFSAALTLSSLAVNNGSLDAQANAQKAFVLMAKSTHQAQAAQLSECKKDQYFKSCNDQNLQQKQSDITNKMYALSQNVTVSPAQALDTLPFISGAFIVNLKVFFQSFGVPFALSFLAFGIGKLIAPHGVTIPEKQEKKQSDFWRLFRKLKPSETVRKTVQATSDADSRPSARPSDATVGRVKKQVKTVGRTDQTDKQIVAKLREYLTTNPGEKYSKTKAAKILKIGKERIDNMLARGVDLEKIWKDSSKKNGQKTIFNLVKK